MEPGYHPITPTEAHYSQHQHSGQVQSQQTSRQAQWPPHLLPPSQSHSQSSFPSPASPSSALSEQQQYPAYYHPDNPMHGHQQLDRSSSSLSLNLSSLSVASPTNLSPINPPSAVSSTLSPVTPISPGSGLQNTFAHQMQHQFQFTPSDRNQNQSQPQSQAHSPIAQFDEHQHQQPYNPRPLATPITTASRSSSSGSSSLPRKRSFSSSTTHTSATTGTSTSTSPLLEEPLYDDTMELSYDDMSAYNGGGGGGNGSGSPIDGSSSGDGGEEHGMGLGLTGASTGGIGAGAPASGMTVLGKPMGTNNFVTKLYQMINDPKSAQFIAWTDLGTSFVVSNVGEFSRSILGSHFKHNNFSSFVRQLNMYGFHKINRTPRAQRTSTDAQTWEFSHHKFLRARPDLLDEIKRKALEPDPTIKQRVELPGEVAAQLGQMRDENRRIWDELSEERRKVDKLVGVVGHLWDVVGKAFPGNVPPFPSDLMDPGESPNIFITSPTTATTGSRYPQPLSMNLGSQSLHSLHSISSPGSSPTQGEGPSHHPKSLSRQQSFQHVTYRSDHGSTPVTPLPPSPASATMDLYDGDACADSMGRGSAKRQRTSSGQSGPGGGQSESSSSSTAGSTAVPKRISRARSDSAPLGYGLGVGLNGWQGGTRPRSGSGMAPPRSGMGMPNIGTMTRGSGGAPPLLSISTLTSNSPR